MFREVEESTDTRRRWFVDDFFELIVWFDDQGTVQSFQLCYDRNRAERAVTWTKVDGFRHDVIDDGESSPLKNRTPLLQKGGEFDRQDILQRFRSVGVHLPRDIREFVEERIEELAP